MKGTAYLVQATLISLWWIGLLINQDFYNAFQFPGISSTAFNSFLLPDIVVISVLSIVRAYNRKIELEYIILGGFGYASLYCLNASIITGGGILATTVMMLGLFYNIFLVFEEKMFRNSSTNNMLINGLKTFIQIICVWTITLIIFPILIINSFGESLTTNSESIEIGIVLFLACSILGIYSAYTMVAKGKGTPLPIDQSQNLVISGPYKYVRNPMAIAGIGQAISISIILWSIYILVYSLIGLILWQFVVRPIEERNLKLRFGKQYEEYRTRVNCWIPKIN